MNKPTQQYAQQAKNKLKSSGKQYGGANALPWCKQGKKAPKTINNMGGWRRV